MSYEYSTHVLTSDGFKSLHDLTTKDFVYDNNGRLGSVTYKQTYPINDSYQFSLVQNSIDSVPFVIKNNTVVDVVNRTLQKQFLPFQTVQEGDWLFHPWIQRDQLHIRSSIDLSKTSDNFYDSNSLYLFNNRILKISEDLGISQKAVKEILVREAAEYEEYIPLVYDYIKTHFEIDSKPEEGSIESFIEFKHFVKDNFVFKMNRYVDIDLNFMAFVVATLSRCKVNKTAPTNKSFIYELAYRFDSRDDASMIDSLIEFVKTLDVKYEIKQTNENTFINLFNKPLFDFVQSSLLVNLTCVINASKECQDYFLAHLFTDKCTKINTCKTLAYQIKELFYYDKQVVGITDAVEGFETFLMQDNFTDVDSTLIVTQEGFYSKVVSKQPLNEDDLHYSYFESQDKSTILLQYTSKR